MIRSGQVDKVAKLISHLSQLSQTRGRSWTAVAPAITLGGGGPSEAAVAAVRRRARQCRLDAGQRALRARLDLRSRQIADQRPDPLGQGLLDGREQLAPRRR